MHAGVQKHLHKEGAPEIILDSGKELSEEDYYGLYTGADVYVLPFRGEGFALTIFEVTKKIIFLVGWVTCCVWEVVANVVIRGSSIILWRGALRACVLTRAKCYKNHME